MASRPSDPPDGMREQAPFALRLLDHYWIQGSREPQGEPSDATSHGKVSVRVAGIEVSGTGEGDADYGMRHDEGGTTTIDRVHSSDAARRSTGRARPTGRTRCSAIPTRGAWRGSAASRSPAPCRPRTAPRASTPGRIGCRCPRRCDGSKRPACSLERVRLDLSDEGARRSLFDLPGREAGKALIITEGFLVYLTADEAAALARDLAAPRAFRRWVRDLASPGLVRMVQKQVGAHLGRASAPLLLRLLAFLPESAGRQGSRPWSGVCLMARADSP